LSSTRTSDRIGVDRKPALDRADPARLASEAGPPIPGPRPHGSTGSAGVGAGLSVDAIPIRCFRVLLNLVRNAAQALESRPRSDAAALQIRITGRREGSVCHHRGLRYRSRRSRQGPRASFSRHSRPRAAPGGSGLGLAIAAELVPRPGGDIHLVEGHHRRDLSGSSYRTGQWELLSVRNERARA